MSIRIDAAERLRLDVAAELYGGTFEPAGYNEYGSVIEPGYKVEASSDGAVRVSHKMPEADLLDPDRLSSDERWRIRIEACAKYAGALRSAGWEATDPVIKGGSFEPWLIARRGNGGAR